MSNVVIFFLLTMFYQLNNWLIRNTFQYSSHVKSHFSYPWFIIDFLFIFIVQGIDFST